MNTKHTPGPWDIGGRDYHPGEILGPDYQTIAKMGFEDNWGNDARLIAAAPDLLAALELATATIDRLTTGYPAKVASVQGTLQVAEAAIRKAKGE